jgi:hypothetical protein
MLSPSCIFVFHPSPNIAARQQGLLFDKRRDIGLSVQALWLNRAADLHMSLKTEPVLYFIISA